MISIFFSEKVILMETVAMQRTYRDDFRLQEIVDTALHNTTHSAITLLLYDCIFARDFLFLNALVIVRTLAVFLT